jgi:methionyl aminopeptidase
MVENLSSLNVISRISLLKDRLFPRNMAIFTAHKDIALLREAGKRLATILEAVVVATRPGVETTTLNMLAEERIREGGDTPSFLDYTPIGAERPYPATLCISINNEVVHGIPNEGLKIVQEGDIVSLDLGLIHQGIFVDMARTIAVGVVDEAGTCLMQATERALLAGIAVARPGARIGDISEAIAQSARSDGFSIVRELGGHGVGRAVHEAPYVPNIGEKGTGPKITVGMTLAIEPMLNEGSRHIVLGADGYTYRTKDGKRSAHFEHTIFVTEEGVEIVTKADDIP